MTSRKSVLELAAVFDENITDMDTTETTMKTKNEVLGLGVEFDGNTATTEITMLASVKESTSEVIEYLSTQTEMASTLN